MATTRRDLLLALASLPLASRLGRAAEPPRALVLEFADPWTGALGAAAGLSQAGFSVQTLPLDRAPKAGEADLIWLGSFTSEHPEYGRYMKAYAADLQRFVSAGGVLVLMTQADQVEAVPPFLPDGLSARRADPDYTTLLDLAPGHPLLAGLTPAGQTEPKALWPAHFGRGGAWEAYCEQTGFRVLLANDHTARQPALMEAALGRGRMVLSALYFDKTVADKAGREGQAAADPAYLKAAAGFFANVRAYTEQVKAGTAPPVVPTPAYQPPAPLPWVPGSFTLAVLPDTQVYAMSYPKHFMAQAQWIVDHRVDRNIKYMLHLGDIVNNNNEPQWEVAQRALSLLDGKVPMALAPGNHDYGPGGSASTRDTLLNRYFPFDRYKSTLGGWFEEGRLDNTWHTFRGWDRDWLVIALEFGPRDEVVAWADQVAAQHRDKLGIVITHAFVFSDSTRYDHTKAKQAWNPHDYPTAKLPGGVNDGEELWLKLVSRHPNRMLAMNGHVLNDGLGYLVTPGAAGQPVHQILSNYQMKTEGGEAYLRLMEFLPDKKTVQVKSYSPSLDKYKTEPDNQFVIELAPPKA